MTYEHIHSRPTHTLYIHPCKPHKIDTVFNLKSYFIVSDIDECSTSPCLNGGICTNLQGDYRCTCAQGYIGTNCETGTSDDHRYMSQDKSNGIGKHFRTCRCWFLVDVKMSYVKRNWSQVVNLDSIAYNLPGTVLRTNLLHCFDLLYIYTDVLKTTLRRGLLRFFQTILRTWRVWFCLLNLGNRRRPYLLGTTLWSRLWYPTSKAF